MPVTAYFEGARFLKVSVTALFEIAGRPAGRWCVYNFVNLVFTKRGRFEKFEKKNVFTKKRCFCSKNFVSATTEKCLTKKKLFKERCLEKQLNCFTKSKSVLWSKIIFFGGSGLPYRWVFKTVFVKNSKKKDVFHNICTIFFPAIFLIKKHDFREFLEKYSIIFPNCFASP